MQFGDTHIGWHELSWILAAPFWRLKRGLRRMIVRAAPTCTLWEPWQYGDWFEFAPYREWRISALELFELSA